MNFSVGSLVKYNEKAIEFLKLPLYRGGQGQNCSDWLGLIVDENPNYVFVVWLNQDYYDSGTGQVEDRCWLELVQ